MATRHDFAPLFRSSIGFDRMLDALEAASRLDTPDKWPPYDIVKTGEDDYRIDMAVAGFTENDLTLTQDKNMLIVSGHREDSDKDGNSYLYRGIAGRSFERRFELADHVRVEGASLSDGLLTVKLKREIPEELRPRRIEIASQASDKGGQPAQITTSSGREPAAA
ncbi:Hsp20 family protein [Paracoccus seriniphilus]|uniref:Molecular chaperone IbpA n=1 Tax=Paracoccus seriniphilus TaxID=184748 RepID=A0A239PRL7_9RHOB|nr:Hsp20 family protein [Paracoccus seriniphilus]WCR13024.1 Hsp20 family protein [Paracoccus seriniphilus]SNT72536.1 molecular chaperone IbpA [Paracoccus seriniphilus]